MIHESISLVRDYDYQTPYYQWLADIRFAGSSEDIRLRSIKLERNTSPKEGDDEKLNKILSSDKNLKEIFNKDNQNHLTRKKDLM